MWVAQFHGKSLTSSELEIFLFLNRGMWILNQFFSLEFNFDYHAVRKPGEVPAFATFATKTSLWCCCIKINYFEIDFFIIRKTFDTFFKCIVWLETVPYVIQNPLKSITKCFRNKKKSFHGQLSYLRIFWKNRNKVANTGAPVLQKALGSILDFSFWFFKFRKVAKTDVRISIVYWKILMF